MSNERLEARGRETSELPEALGIPPSIDPDTGDYGLAIGLLTDVVGRREKGKALIRGR